MVQNAMARQGLTLELLEGIGRKQFSSRQGIVGGITNSLGVFRNVRISKTSADMTEAIFYDMFF